MAGLYFHIPYCLQKCQYCDFVSFPRDLAQKEGQDQDSYTEALLIEIQLKKQLLRQQEWSTLFFGGGTPSLLSVRNLERILKELGDIISLGDIREFTIEVNPKTLSKLKLQSYKRIGVNRLSIGVQSFCDKELEVIGRIHTSNDAIETIKRAQHQDFFDISLDLMYGLPGQDINSLLNNIKVAASLDIAHISLYGLQVEKNTPLALKVDRGETILPNEEEMYEMYLKSVSILQELGYQQYEISNFAKTSKECLHNLVYWNYNDYIGFGLGSHSKIGNKRYANTHSLSCYIKKIKKRQLPIDFEENLTGLEMEFEKSMLSLRTKKGIPISVIKNSYALKDMVNADLATLQNDRLILTAKGYLVSNEIINKLI